MADTPRNRWIAFWRLFRLLHNPLHNTEGGLEAFYLLMPDSRWFKRFLRCAMDSSRCDWTEFSWSEHPRLRRLFKPKLGPPMEHIACWEDDAA